MKDSLKNYLKENLVPDLRSAIVSRVYSPPQEWLSLIEKNRAEGWLRYHKKVILRNFEEALRRNLPMCQDTGAFNFVVSVTPEFVGKWSGVCGGWGEIKRTFVEILTSLVGEVSKEAYLRPSILVDPFDSKNTGDNTPPFVEFELSDVNRVRFFMKGGGSENGTYLEMLPPSKGFEGVMDFLKRWAVEKAVGVCPPVYVSLVVGGTPSYALSLSKKMLFGLPEKFGYPDMEKEAALIKELFDSILGEGYVVAFSGRKLPRHIASMPAAVSVSCNAWRVGEVVF